MIDPKTGKHTSETKLIWKGSGNFGTEGPHIFKRKDFYYLLVAEGGTHGGHMVSIARSASPWGPFESYKANPILTHRDELWRRIQATGHGDMVEAHDGSWWLVCLGIRNYGSLMHLSHTLGRETCLAPVDWNSEGWPVVNSSGKVDEEMKVRTLTLKPWPQSLLLDNFEEGGLAMPWNFLRNQDISLWSLSGRKGWLVLHGNANNLDSISPSAFIGRRQEHHYCKVSTQLDFIPSSDNEEAGITVFAAENYHFDFAITTLKGRRNLIVRRNVDDIKFISLSLPIPDGDLTL
jgi:alpha-N-arabinofuranosidase